MSPRRSNLSLNQKIIISLAILGIIATIFAAFVSGHDWFSPSLPTPTVILSSPSKNIMSLGIEQISGDVVSYDGLQKNMGGIASITRGFVDSTPSYIFTYELPTDKEGFAGFVFVFDQAEDVSQFEKIEFAITFQSTNGKIDLYFQDNTGKQDSVRVISNGLDPMNKSIPLSEFAEIDLNALKEVKFDVNTTFESGSQEIIVDNIHFVP
jgi:hypothetical protein